MADRKFGFETLCLHAGQIPDAATGALATSTGQAAEATAILTLCNAGDHIVSASTLYGGTHTLLGVNLKKLGIETTFVQPDEPENFRRAIRKNTKLIYAETLGNPLINVVDIEALAKIAHEAEIPLVLDNTVPSPYLLRPIEWGADIVLHSATKYIGGHGTTMGGVIVESGKFNWGNGKFPEFTSPSPGYHGVIFHETFGDFGFTMKARMEIMRTFGPTLPPLNAWLLLQGLQALPVRMDRHCDNALAVAEFLQNHPRVAWVNYPGLADNKYSALAKKYFPKGASGLLNFGIKGQTQTAAARAGER